MRGRVLAWVKGTVKLRLEGECCERFFNLCAFHEIPLWDLKPSEEGYEIHMALQHFRMLKPLAKKCRIRIRILSREGLPFLLYRSRKRKVWIGSSLASFLLLFLLSLFVWEIHISGNLTITDEQILDILKEESIGHGSLKARLDCRQLGDKLRMRFPEITWVSVKLSGTRLLIDVKEMEEGKRQTEFSEPCDLVCDTEGEIVRMVTRAGTPLVSTGTQVKKGDLLVTGRVELINDSGEVYDHRYVSADADIFVKTVIRYEDVMEHKQLGKRYTGKSCSRRLLQIGPLRVGLPFRRPSFRQFDSVKQTRQLRLTDQFYLPVFYTCMTLREYHTTWQICTPEEAEKRLEQNFRNFIEKIQEKGVQIFQNDVKIETTDSVSTAEGELIVIQKAGKRTALVMQNQKEGISAE